MKTPFTINHQPFFILGGQVHNSSGYNAAILKTAGQALKLLHANTAEVPVYWEQIEPEEDQFDFSSVHEVIAWARELDVRLVLLWFATWKNGSMQYAPEWVKANPERFYPVLNPAGRAIWVLSSHCQATLEADRKAFCALMDDLKKFDEEKRVIAIQIENEPGILSSIRDYGPEAEKEYESQLPAALTRVLQSHCTSPICQSWVTAGKKDQNWELAFDLNAPEYFSAWSIASYIDEIARAGKEIYDLPMYVNVWLKENGWQLPGTNYPSGGPTSNVLDLWKWATPHIDLIAPDIYIENPNLYQQVCQAYQRADNPLFVPESGHSLSNALHIFEAIGRYQAIGYAMFGIESLLDEQGAPKSDARQTVESFQCAAAALPLIQKLHGTSKIFPVIQREFQGEQVFDFGSYWGMAKFTAGETHTFTDFRHRTAQAPQRGRGLIFQTGEKEFYLVGGGYRLLLKEKVSDRQEFSGSNDQFDAPLTHYLRVEEGHFAPDGAWVVDLHRNGDEVTSGLWVAPDVGVVKAVLA